MKIHTVGLAILGLILSAPDCALAGPAPAIVTEKVNIVKHGTTTSAELSAEVGTAITDGEYVVTGPKSRAELTLPSASITRLGANTIFNYDAESNAVDLQAGTILFCKPKGACQLNIKTAAITAAIVGTTGFVNVHQNGEGRKIYVFGVVEGLTTAHVNGEDISVGGGDCIWYSPGAKPKPFSYDLPRYTKTSALLTAFKKPLPNQPEIDAAVGSYGGPKKGGAGAVTPDQIIYGGDVPALSPAAVESALKARSP